MDANEFDNYRVETDAKIATLEKSLNDLQSASDEKDKEISKLQAYIATYVSSPKKNEGNGIETQPKSFNDIYNETLLEMKNKKE